MTDSTRDAVIAARQAEGIDTYERVLGRWTLHDCSGFEDGLNDGEMVELFRRWRATRSKPDAASGRVTERSLDCAWTAFVERWNTEGADAFQRKLARREEQHSRLSVRALADQICNLSWMADRDCCYVHFKQRCTSCSGNSVQQPDVTRWEDIVKAVPLSGTERSVIGLYDRALSEARRGGPSRHDEVPSHTLQQHLEHRPEVQRAVPSYPQVDRAIAPGTGGAAVGHHRDAERRDFDAVDARDRHHEPIYPRQYVEYYHPRQQVERDHRVGMEERDRWEDAAMARRLDRMERRLRDLERENGELRHQLPQQWAPRRAAPDYR